MSVYTIARAHVGAAVTDAETERLPVGDCLHALLVTVVEALKQERGQADTRRALEFQMNNLADDRDYEFMRP
jgi:F420-0:gamma-glutamyl ligase